MSLEAAQTGERSAVRPATTTRALPWAPEWLLALPFLAPALLFYGVFLLVPLLGAVALSLTSWSGFNVADIRFVGFDNFGALGRDDVFWLSLRHNLTFLVASVVLKTLVALFLAI